MKAETGKRVQQVAGYVFVILVTGILLYRLLGLSGLDIVRYPINYSSGGDSWTGMATVKSMADNGWIYNNALLGAPDGAKYYDATTMELVLNAMEQVLVWITGNWVLAFNLFYFSGYFLAGVTAYYALKKLDISGVIAAPTAVLYAFAPYHMARSTGHLFLGMYFMVPIMVLFLFRMMQEEQLFQKGKRGFLTAGNVMKVITLMIMALTGIYYAFFMCFFLCVVILCKILNGEGRKIRQPLFGIGVIVGTLLIGAIPNLLYWAQNGKSPALAKGGEGAEIYGLKIIQLLLPIKGHRREVLMRLRNLYDSAYPLVNENGSASLGLFMALGFVLLCLVLFVGRKRLKEQGNIRIAATLNLAAVLFGTIGGFAVILSFITGSIRCYNRFSIFIAMFSLIAIDTVLQWIRVKWFQGRKWKQILFAGGMLIILSGGIYDQTVPRSPETHTVSEQIYDADDVFIKQIEAVEEPGAMIYQLPYMKYPENGGIQQLMDYGLLVGYLHSDTLKWSYGAPSERETDIWMRELNEKPLTEQIDMIREKGFSGIYIDWNAYLPDERVAMESILETETGTTPLLHEDGMKAYYSFK